MTNDKVAKVLSVLLTSNYTSIDPDSQAESHDLLTTGWNKNERSLHSQLTAPP